MRTEKNDKSLGDAHILSLIFIDSDTQKWTQIEKFNSDQQSNECYRLDKFLNKKSTYCMVE